jgi:hypothetical protein
LIFTTAALEGGSFGRKVNAGTKIISPSSPAGLFIMPLGASEAVVKIHSFPISWRAGNPACGHRSSSGYRIPGGVNGVDQLRLDVASRLSVGVDWSSAFFHVVVGSFFLTTHSLGASPADAGYARTSRSLESTEDTEPQCRIRFIFSSVFSVPSSAAGGLKIFFPTSSRPGTQPDGLVV